MTGSCSAVLSTFRGVHLITQSVCVGLVTTPALVGIVSDAAFAD